MKDSKAIIKVSVEHIEAGINKYKGIVDAVLAYLIKKADLNYAHINLLMVAFC